MSSDDDLQATLDFEDLTEYLRGKGYRKSDHPALVYHSRHVVDWLMANRHYAEATRSNVKMILDTLKDLGHELSREDALGSNTDNIAYGISQRIQGKWLKDKIFLHKQL